MTQGTSVALRPVGNVLGLVDVRAREDIGMTFVDIALDVNGERREASARSSTSLCEALDRAVRHIVPHDARLHLTEIERDGALIVVTVRYAWYGQVIVGNARDEDKDKARVVILAILGAVGQVMCGGPSH